MARPPVLAALTAALALSACGGGTPASNHQTHVTRAADRSVRAHLDCGSGRAGSQHALRQFTAVLRRGDRREIRAVLIDRPRFFALSAQGHPGPNVGVRGHPDAAAKAVADRGGFPVRIDTFMNSEPPRRDTGFGFRGMWNGARHLIGKAAIDSNLGKVIVFNVGVRRR